MSPHLDVELTVDGAVRRLTVDPRTSLLVERVAHVRIEYVGPRRLAVVADVDLTGDDPEPVLARRLRAVETRLTASPTVAAVELGLAVPEGPDLTLPARPSRGVGAR